MYSYKIIQLGVDGTRKTLEEISANPILTQREMEEFIEDHQVHWIRETKQPDMSMVKIERRLTPLK